VGVSRGDHVKVSRGHTSEGVPDEAAHEERPYRPGEEELSQACKDIGARSVSNAGMMNVAGAKAGTGGYPV
jgi:hypothetical protein